MFMSRFIFRITAIADEAATTTGPSRIKAAGIKSFKVDFTGTDPYQAPRYLKADLSLYVENLANLFDKVPGYAPLAEPFYHIYSKIFD